MRTLKNKQKVPPKPPSKERVLINNCKNYSLLKYITIRGIHQNCKRTRLEKKLKKELAIAQEKNMKLSFYLLLLSTFIVITVLGLIFLP